MTANRSKSQHHHPRDPAWCRRLLILLAIAIVICAAYPVAGQDPATSSGSISVAAGSPAPLLPGTERYPDLSSAGRGFYDGIREAFENHSFLILIQLMGVIIIVAYFLTRSRVFPEILDGHPSRKTQIMLVVVFGALSVYGTLSGIDVEGAHINVRDLGPMVAGLLAGPYVGIAAGLIGAAFRLTLGGFTVEACSLAAVFAGLFGGLVWLKKDRKFCGITVAVLLAVFMELFHMALILALSRPFDDALEVVWAVVLPMILANTAGMFIFAFMVRNFENERSMQVHRDALLREMEHKNTELAIAAGIQQDFLPTELPGIEGYGIAAKNIPAKDVGGDFYDVIPPSGLPCMGKKTAVLIADVSGKGVPAALFMALSQTVVHVLSTTRSSPEETMAAADAIISSRSGSGMFVTLFYGILDPESRSLAFINAGHVPPLILRAAGTFEELHATGPALGITGTGRYRQYSVPFAPGDILILFTDGITEALNGGKEEFGTDRLIETLRAVRQLPPRRIIDEVTAAVSAFAGKEPQTDDITIMVIRAG